MKTKSNYQPEDIEALLAEKAFHELYSEEKVFVLEHLASASEYEQMRETLLSIRGASGDDHSSASLRTSPRVKQELMSAFEKERKKRALIWWNSLSLFLRTNLRFDLPVVRFSFAAVVLLVGIWFAYRAGSNTNDTVPVLAKNETKTIDPAVPSSNEKRVSATTDSVKDKIANEPVSNTDQLNPPPLPQQDFVEQPETPKRTAEIPVQPQLNFSVDTARTAAMHTNGLIGITTVKRPNNQSLDIVGPFAGNNMNTNYSNNITLSSGYGSLFNNNSFQLNNGTTGIDTTKKARALGDRLATGSTGTAVGLDTVNPVVLTNAGTVCCASSAGLVTATGGSTYSWTPSTLNASSLNMNTSAINYTISNVNGNYHVVVPKSRSLAYDPDAIALFCELK